MKTSNQVRKDTSKKVASAQSKNAAKPRQVRDSRTAATLLFAEQWFHNIKSRPFKEVIAEAALLRNLTNPIEELLDFTEGLDVLVGAEGQVREFLAARVPASWRKGAHHAC